MTEQIAVRIKVAQNAHPEEKAHRYESMRRLMGNNLLDFLDKQKSLVSVEVEESRDTVLEWGILYDIITLCARTEDVRHNHIIHHATAPIDYVPEIRKKSLFERVQGFMAMSERNRKELWG